MVLLDWLFTERLILEMGEHPSTKGEGAAFIKAVSIAGESSNIGNAKKINVAIAIKE